jgi:hypothetical protein
MLEGPMEKLLDVPPELQVSVDEVEPLMVIETVEPELVSVALPVKTHVVVKGPPGQGVSGTLSVAVEPVSVKLMLPDATVVEPQSIK